MTLPQPTVLGQTPHQIRHVPDHPKNVENPKMANDYLWFFGENEEEGLDIEIHPNLKFNGDEDWNDEDEWQWFVNMHRMAWDEEYEEHIEDQGDMVSVPKRSFEDAVQYANEKAQSICKNDSELRYLLP